MKTEVKNAFQFSRHLQNNTVPTCDGQCMPCFPVIYVFFRFCNSKNTIKRLSLFSKKSHASSAHIDYFWSERMDNGHFTLHLNEIWSPKCLWNSSCLYFDLVQVPFIHLWIIKVHQNGRVHLRSRIVVRVWHSFHPWSDGDVYYQNKILPRRSK